MKSRGFDRALRGDVHGVHAWTVWGRVRKFTIRASSGLMPAVEAWGLTAAISPRRVVRAATRTAEGVVENSYPLVHPVEGRLPETPWAVCLADRDGRFRLVCADLDARGASADPKGDARRLSDVLTEEGIAHVVCESGPSGGRHVWFGLAEAQEAETVASLARLLKAWLPSLDVSPLLNPASGCVRPPGAPHRSGGSSRVLSGDVACLVSPEVTAAQIQRLLQRLAERVSAGSGTPVVAPRRTAAVSLDGEGMPFLSGPRRELAASSRRALASVPSGDASAVLWRILCGAAIARWRFADLAGLMAAPGLEHVRTVRCGTQRVSRPPRGAASPGAVLRRQWSRAVTAMAHAGIREGRPAGDDPSFDGRADVIAAVMRQVQGRADASIGRWQARRHQGERLVLDALCLFQTEAVAVEVEADIRRLALTCGVDRETVRRALLALADDGWIERTRPASGVRGAYWTVDPAGVIHRRVVEALSQADPRPAGVGTAERLVALQQIRDRVIASAHDAFSPTGGLGVEAGRLYGRMSEPLDLVESAQLTGLPLERTQELLERLAAVGLVVADQGRWRRTGAENLDRVASELGTEGRRSDREAAYGLERLAWAWWLAELDRMRRGRQRARGGVNLAHSEAIRRLPVGMGSGQWQPHPRHPDGRAAFAQARAVLASHVPKAGASDSGARAA